MILGIHVKFLGCRCSWMFPVVFPNQNSAFLKVDLNWRYGWNMLWWNPLPFTSFNGSNSCLDLPITPKKQPKHIIFLRGKALNSQEGKPIPRLPDLFNVLLTGSSSCPRPKVPSMVKFFLCLERVIMKVTWVYIPEFTNEWQARKSMKIPHVQ